jgi:ATP-binding cassette subfamily C protein CydD
MRSRRSSTPTVEGRLLAFEPRVRPRLWLAVAFGTASAVCTLAAASVLSGVVSRVFLEGADLASVLPLLGIAALLALARAGCLLLQEVVAQRASSGLRGSLRSALTAHILALGPIHASGQRSGELVTAMSGGLDDIDLYVTSYQPARRLAAIVPLLVMVVVLLIDPPTALVLLLTGPVLVLLLAVIGGRTRVISGRRALELRWLGAFFLDMLQGLATLRMFGRGREQVETIRAVSRQYGETTMDVLRTAFQTALVLEWGGAVATAVVAVEVSLRLIDGQMAFDRALAVLVILPLRQLAIRYHSGSAGRAAAERLFEILDTPVPGRATPIQAAAWQASPTKDVPLGDIRFEDVWFSYEGRDPALCGLDLAIPQGTVVALVGATGAGKTTCSSLLLRFLEPDTGLISVGGTALNAIDRSAWLASVAWVPQRPHLFHGTVADNIRLGRPDATDEQVRAAARAANAAAFIEALPQGYATHIGEAGDRLSGGQRQRLAIARAYLKDAPYLVLDEATSHLDAASEAAIGAAIPDLVRGRTVLIISHRMRLAALADRIVTLAEGRAVAA